MIKTPLSTVIGGAFWTPGATVIGGSSQPDRGLLIGSTTYLIGSAEGFIGNRLPITS